MSTKIMKGQGEEGFTLIEFMIASGMLVVGMWALADSAVIHARAQVTSNTESEIALVFDRVQGITGAEWSCTAALTGAHQSSALVVNDPVSLKPVASEGKGGGNAWTLTQVRMQAVEQVPGQPGVVRGTLYLQASKNMALNLGSPVVSRVIPDIYFETSPDGTIARCYTTSDTAAAGKSACQLLGGTWNWSAERGSQCLLPTAVGG